MSLITIVNNTKVVEQSNKYNLVRQEKQTRRSMIGGKRIMSGRNKNPDGVV